MTCFTPPLTAGEVQRAFPDLQVYRLIDTGGQGCVFQVSDQKGSLLALKIYGRRQDMIERVAREVRALQDLSHQYVVRLHDDGFADLRGEARRWTLTDFIDGTDLRKLLRSSRLLDDEVRALIRCVGAAIDAMWGVRVVHRDIKPENIMRRQDGAFVVIDLGIAKHLARTPITGAFVPGTLGYMSPEQMLGRRALTLRSDLFALGIVAYELLTGLHPFNYQQALVLTLMPDAPSSHVPVSPALDAAILALLARNPAQRPPSGRAAAAPL